MHERSNTWRKYQGPEKDSVCVFKIQDRKEKRERERDDRGKEPIKI